MLTRRIFVGLSAHGLAALCGLLPLLKACGSPANPAKNQPQGEDSAAEPLDWTTFLAGVDQLALEQFSGAWEQEAYVEEMATLMRRLSPQDPILLEELADAVGAIRNFPDIVTLVEGPDHSYDVAIVVFEEGEEIPLHDHPDMTGVILGLTGEVEIQSFNLLPELSASGALQLQRLAVSNVTPGVHATLTANRGNIHSLRAISRTELLDVFTPGYNQDRSVRSKWFTRSSTPVDGTTDIFEAEED